MAIISGSIIYIDESVDILNGSKVAGEYWHCATNTCLPYDPMING